MTELLNKLSSYHVFNYLLPGIVFSYVLTWTTRFSINPHDVLTGAFVYYFVGLVVSRFGSLVIEPVLKRTKFVHYAPYKEYVVNQANKIKRCQPPPKMLSATSAN